MTDAAGKWDAATLTTVASLTKIEREITQLVDDGTDTYSVQDVDVASAIVPASINISSGLGILEIICVAETECVFSGFSISVTESDDDDTFTAYGTGLVIFAKTGTVAAGTELFRYIIPSDMDDYFKPAVTIGTSTGTISIYSESVYDNKIEIAKEMIGDDASEMLLNNHLLEYIEEDDDILDCIYTPADLGLVSDFLTLSLIYSDLAQGDAESAFMNKSKAYRKDYTEHLRKKFKLLTIDPDQAGGSLIYYSKMSYISQAGR